MTRYVVVNRATRMPLEHFLSPYSAAYFIVRERRYADWHVLAQDGDPTITAGTPFRKLTPRERFEVEKALYPTLFE